MLMKKSEVCWFCTELDRQNRLTNSRIVLGRCTCAKQLKITSFI